MANEFIARKGLIALSDSQITGSLDITGSLSLPGISDVSASLAAAVAGGDNLGNHTATQNLDMGTYAITNVGNVDGRDVSADGSKLDGIEAGADVTDTANVTAAGALMDSEVDADIKTLSLPANTTISTFGASLVDDADAAAARTTLGVDAAGTDNSTNVTLAGSYDYITLSGQTITRNQIDLSTDVTGQITTSSITSFPTEVSRSAAAAGFGSGGGGGGGSDFPYTGSAIISGSLEIIGKVTGSVLIEGSGSTLFEVVGSEGQLFSITDSLSGSLFAVSDVSGIPILEVFSDDTVKIGTFNNEAITVSGSHTTIGGTLAIPGFTDVSASLAAAGGGSGISFNGSTANGVVTYGNATTADVEANLTFDGTSLSIAGTLPLYTPSMTTGVDNSVVILDSDGYLKTDEIDSRVWGSTLIDYTGTPASTQLSYFNDINTLAAAPTFTILNNGKFLQINDGDAASGPVGIYTDVVNDIEGAGGDIFVGDIAQIGSAISTVEGYVYNLSGSWAAALADDPSTSTGFLAIGTETTGSSNTFLTRGYFNVSSSYFQGTYVQGAPIYIHVSATGRYNFLPPSGNGDVSRIIGHVVDSFTPDRTTYVYYKIYFNPSPDWIEL